MQKGDSSGFGCCQQHTARRRPAADLDRDIRGNRRAVYQGREVCTEGIAGADHEEEAPDFPDGTDG
jgi:hypothetical protein